MIDPARAELEVKRWFAAELNVTPEEVGVFIDPTIGSSEVAVFEARQVSSSGGRRADREPPRRSGVVTQEGVIADRDRAQAAVARALGDDPGGDFSLGQIAYVMGMLESTAGPQAIPVVNQRGLEVLDSRLQAVAKVPTATEIDGAPAVSFYVWTREIPVRMWRVTVVFLGEGKVRITREPPATPTAPTR